MAHIDENSISVHENDLNYLFVEGKSTVYSNKPVNLPDGKEYIIPKTLVQSQVGLSSRATVVIEFKFKYNDGEWVEDRFFPILNFRSNYGWPLEDVNKLKLRSKEQNSYNSMWEDTSPETIRKAQVYFILNKAMEETKNNLMIAAKNKNFPKYAKHLAIIRDRYQNYRGED